MIDRQGHTTYFVTKILLLFFFLVIQERIASQSADTTGVISDTTEVMPIEKDRFEKFSLNGDSLYQGLNLPDSTLQKFLSDEDFWYANQVPPKQKTPTSSKVKEPFFIQKWFKTLVWVLIIASFAGVILWFLIASDVRLFRRKSLSVAQVEMENFAGDIYSIDYETATQHALHENHFRLAIRLMYLHVLRLMAEADIIQYKVERTNSDYLAQVYATAYYPKFFRMTRNFEYAWYGKFPITEKALEEIKNNYDDLKRQLT